MKKWQKNIAKSLGHNSEDIPDEMETETLDKLYLEWSQFTGARTNREIAAVNLCGSARTRLELSECSKEDIKWVIDRLDLVIEKVRSEWMDKMV